ncbi:hypothetical protein GCM10023321_15190 [Pseudonocardia eucalypti]|uniref:Integral membrane protein n=1 Tax=Pseudonocardia eucalypti TaxID=648755 RepID=A0ABP9PUX6_9PSEU|nr:hypothetical protein [Pseudonocardia eucalypti]
MSSAPPTDRTLADPPTGADAPPAEPVLGPGDRFRLLGTTALASVLLSLLASAVVAGLAGLTAGAPWHPAGLIRAAVPLWLAAHQVPLVVDGVPLGVLPLLPTLGLGVVIGALATRLTRRLGGRAREDGSAVIATLGGTHASVAVLATALPADPAPASPWGALLGAGIVAAVAAGLGTLRATGVPAWWPGLPLWLRTGLVAARQGACALASAGALLLFAALLGSISEMHARLVAGPPELGAGLGLIVLSLCYLPNALVASVSWLAGPGVSIGAATASPLFTSAGPLPAVPLMAAMPLERPPGWTALVFLLPVLVGALVGRRCRDADPAEPLRRLPAVGVAAGVVAVGAALLAAVVSGSLAGGPFDPVVLPPIGLAAALLGWVGVPALAVALLPGYRGPGRSKGLWRTKRSRMTVGEAVALGGVSAVAGGAVAGGGVAGGGAGAGLVGAGAADVADGEASDDDFDDDLDEGEDVEYGQDAGDREDAEDGQETGYDEDAGYREDAADREDAGYGAGYRDDGEDGGNRGGAGYGEDVVGREEIRYEGELDPSDPDYVDELDFDLDDHAAPAREPRHADDVEFADDTPYDEFTEEIYRPTPRGEGR